MDYLAPFTRCLIAPAWALWERSPYLRHRRQLMRTQFESPEVICRRQWEKVQSLIEHAYATTHFYRSRLQKASLEPAQIRSFEALRAVPLLTKADLRTDQSGLLSEPYRGTALDCKRTSGSTGVAVQVFIDKEAQQVKRACVLRSDEWSGWRLGERTAVLWGSDENPRRGWRPWLRNALLERITYLDTLKIDEQSMARFLATLRRRPPSLLFGHAHSLYLLAKFVQRRSLGGFRPRGIISAAMVLHEWERRLIEDVFQCKVTNRYGCEEVSLIACECEEHNGLHINADGIYLEVLRPDGTPCLSGEPGRIVVTDLVNRAMPILRYEVGDMGVLSDRSCPCGRGLPLIERIEGRVADYILTPRGELVSGISLTDHFNTLVPGVFQLQIIQEEVDRFVFRIVKDKGFGASSLAKLESLVAERFGPGVHYACEFVDTISQEPSGKFRFCISKVDNPYTRT